MTTKTIEIPTGDGEVLVVPKHPAPLHFGQSSFPGEWLFYPARSGARRISTGATLTAQERTQYGAVAAELWLREAENLCPEGYSRCCMDCRVYIKCSICTDELAARIEATNNVHAARAWGKKGEEK